MDEYHAYGKLGLSWRPTDDSPLGEFARRWVGICPISEQPGSRFTYDQAGTPNPPEDPDLSGALGPVGYAALEPIRHRGLEFECLPPEKKPDGRSGWAIDSLVRGRAARTPPVRLDGLQPTVIDGRVVLEATGASAEYAAFVEQVSLPLFGNGRAMPLRPFRLPLSAPVDDFTANRLLRRVRQLANAQAFGPLLIEDITLMGDPGHGRRVVPLWSFDLGEQVVGIREPSNFGIVGARARREPTPRRPCSQNG